MCAVSLQEVSDHEYLRLPVSCSFEQLLTLTIALSGCFHTFSHNAITRVARCLIDPVRFKSSKPHFFILWPQNINCLFFNQRGCVLSDFLKKKLFIAYIFRLFHDILNIRRSKHISVTSRLLFVCGVIAQFLLPYKRIDFA